MNWDKSALSGVNVGDEELLQMAGNLSCKEEKLHLCI